MINNFLNSEPEWQLSGTFSKNQPNANIDSWLSEPGSLTRRLKQTFSGDFSVSVQAQGLCRPFSQDASQLGLGQNQETFIREVFLSVSGQTLVFARTTVPDYSLNTLDSLTKLGNKPLGEVIFGYPDLERLYLHIAKVARDCLSADMAQMLGEEHYLWARRNTYKIAGQVFLVSEFFLPVMFEDNYSIAPSPDQPAIALAR